MQNPGYFLYGPQVAKIEDQPVHFWRHGGIQTPITTPLVMGHEASGTIAAVGRAVTSVQVGDRVAIEPGHPCRRCLACKEGRYNLCTAMKFAAAPPDVHGTLTKFWKAPEDFVYRLDNEAVSLEEAVLLEPLAVAVHAVRLADIRPGQTVVITGSGTIGLLCAITARAFGAQRIILLDIAETKVAFARAYLGSGSGGVVVETHRMDPTASAEENARTVSDQFSLQQTGEIDQGTAVDTVIEASGAEAAMQLGVYLVKPGGSYVQTGIGQPKPRIPMLALSEKELRVSGCFRYGPGDFSLALNLLCRESLDLNPLISSITPFEEASTAWEMTARGEGVKNLIEGVRD
ncbi:chaperonin 10-like protein [Aspergillus novoparasiticus]|uniref:D-xylulose reductase n=1 Tax=Aspergillus novoparasiticus TaxID=986946 RepID=A0A5N6ERR6_9EURO|nr:chaperonin 10-like protein [Aspergillus novoparasiticus]